MSTHVPCLNAAIAYIVQPPTMTTAPASAATKGSSADMRPTTRATAIVVTTADVEPARAMNWFDSTPSAIEACTWMPGILPWPGWLNGVWNTSTSPDAVSPTKTILSLKTLGSTIGFWPALICSSEYNRWRASYDWYGRLPFTSAGARYLTSIVHWWCVFEGSSTLRTWVDTSGTTRSRI